MKMVTGTCCSMQSPRVGNRGLDRAGMRSAETAGTVGSSSLRTKLCDAFYAKIFLWASVGTYTGTAFNTTVHFTDGTTTNFVSAFNDALFVHHDMC
eukprot:SAG31_NODE_12541_length_934_cov_0.804790_1_plen_96_part_00